MAHVARANLYRGPAADLGLATTSPTKAGIILRNKEDT